jgi:hypothetical protein
MNRPTEQHIAIAKAVLAKCAANDPWFPHPSQVTVMAWAEHIARYNLELGDTLDGVTAAYAANGSGFRPLPKDITDAARAIRRDRTERETEDESDARQTANACRLHAQTLRVVEPPKPNEPDARADSQADVIAARIAEHVEEIATAKTRWQKDDTA